MANKSLERIVVIGGAGAMGRITVTDLCKTAPQFEVVVADYDKAAAEALVRSLRSKRLSAAQVDARSVEATAKVLRGAFAVINAAQHDFNLTVMQAALRAKAHYVDLGGLYHFTKEQLRLHSKFREADLLAVLGVGAAPGITNILAAHAAAQLDDVREIHCCVAGSSELEGDGAGGIDISYSMQTVFEEASRPAALFTGGKVRFIEALSEEWDMSFPQPVGKQRLACTIHSEVLTLPQSYRKRGVQEVSFRIAFGQEVVDKLRTLRSFGLLGDQPVAIGKERISPRDFMVRMLQQRSKPKVKKAPKYEGGEYEILRAVVRGKKDNRPLEVIADCHVVGIPQWNMGVDADTGCPPSICVQMISTGQISARGVLPPERAIEPSAFFPHLNERGMRIKVASTSDQSV
ncbi:MAG: saccharopine dehydrogenase NADP-binding domain-containing protein [Myxococcota bacterium]